MEKEKSRITAAQMGKLGKLLGMRRTYRISNERVRNLFEVEKGGGVDERIEESVLY